MKAPAAAGLKVMLMEQCAPAAKVARQVLVWEKLEALEPTMETELMVSN